MILVVGATGRLGTRVIPHLLAQGERVRAMTRTPSTAQAESLRNQGAEVVRGDLRDPASLARACDGVDKVLDAAHGFTPGQADNNVRTVDEAGNRNLIDAAKAAGVRHFVFVSILGAAPDSPMELFRIKYEAERYLQTSGLSYTVLRAAAYIEFWAAMVGDPILKTGKVTIFGRGENPINFVSADDVAKFCVIALEDPNARDLVISVGGPENLTFNQVAELFEKVGQRSARKTHVPLPVMRVLTPAIRPINPMLSMQVMGGILMDTENQAFDMTATLEQFPMELTRLEDVARRMARGTGD